MLFTCMGMLLTCTYSLRAHPGYDLLQSPNVLGMFNYLESPGVRSTGQGTDGQLLPVLPQPFNLRNCVGFACNTMRRLLRLSD